MPLTSGAYDWFKDRGKRWELRTYGRTYTERTVIPGRSVELRRGYGGESLWGVILQRCVANSLDEIFQTVDFQSVVPVAATLDEAKQIVEDLLGVRQRYIAFEISIQTGAGTRAHSPVENAREVEPSQ